ncbi:hypothetical protein EVAR_93066_1 [Eumeta japonica]|uniref:Uncharacterized protein n=1 Tax=Eumeta variegata TaxID=151549 RepID=A0A4C1TFW0_EUMVA|nr:hypothetical protein EVAR_93066_1 [Eumeta japonica]
MLSLRRALVRMSAPSSRPPRALVPLGGARPPLRARAAQIPRAVNHRLRIKSHIRGSIRSDFKLSTIVRQRPSPGEDTVAALVVGDVGDRQRPRA